jgi:hypothetical protein
MKITKTQLKQIIKEELNEIWVDSPTARYEPPPSSDAKAKAQRYAAKIRDAATLARMKKPLPGGKRIGPSGDEERDPSLAKTISGDLSRKTQAEDPDAPGSDKVREYLELLAAANFSAAEKEALINKLTGE